MDAEPPAPEPVVPEPVDGPTGGGFDVVGLDWPGIGVVAGVCGLVLLALSGRYGYHRDELYFLACGRHLAWGYPDQPPFVPLLARAMSSIAPHSLTVLRLPSDIAAAGTVFLTGAIARELGAKAAGQRLGAITMAIGSFTLGSGHLLSTTTFQLTAWAALIFLTLRIFRTGDERLWPLTGLVAGIGLLDNDLVAFLAVAVGIGVLICGPREVFLSPWLWVGVVIAAALWSPYVIWQAQHNWPEFGIARSIANGGSGTSAPRAAIPIDQLYLASPPLVPIWIAGLVRLLRNGPLRWARALGVAYFVLLVAFIVTGGKPYYLASMFPLLLAAGAQPALDWAPRGSGRRRGWSIAIAVGALIDAVITLPIVPTGAVHDTPIVVINYDAGETIGWPAFVAQIGDVYRQVDQFDQGGAQPIVLASNYGEAGAVERYGASDGMSSVVYSGNNSFWLWGPPPASATTAVAVGFGRRLLLRRFSSVTLATHLSNHNQVSDDEQGVSVWICRDPVRPWNELWVRFRDYSG